MQQQKQQQQQLQHQQQQQQQQQHMFAQLRFLFFIELQGRWSFNEQNKNSGESGLSCCSVIAFGKSVHEKVELFFSVNIKFIEVKCRGNEHNSRMIRVQEVRLKFNTNG